MAHCNVRGGSQRPGCLLQGLPERMLGRLGGGPWGLLEVIGVNWGIIRAQWGSMGITGSQWE